MNRCLGGRLAAARAGALLDPAALQRSRAVLRRVARRRYPEMRERQFFGDRVHLIGHLDRVGIPIGRVAGGRACHQRVELRWHAVDHGAGLRHIVIQPLVGDGQRRVAGERRAPGQQLVGEDAGGVDVAAGTGVAVTDLLGGEVGRGSQNDAGGGDSGGGDGANQPEIGDLDVALVGDQDVLGLDVAVHQARPMRGGQPAQHRAQHRHHGVRRHRAPFGQQLAQRAALDELHDQKRVPGVQTLVVDRDQPGVLQPGDGAGLELEAGQELARRRRIGSPSPSPRRGGRGARQRRGRPWRFRRWRSASGPGSGRPATC